MLVDLHQDAAYYFLTSLSQPPFDVDAEGRQSDLPKLSGYLVCLERAYVQFHVSAVDGSTYRPCSVFRFDIGRCTAMQALRNQKGIGWKEGNPL